jgi:transglutaminase-like putative cysteine protease
MERRECLKAGMALLALNPLLSMIYAQEKPEARTIQRQLRFTLTLANPKTHELIDQNLWFYMPITETATQKLESIQVSMPYMQEIDTLGQTVISLNFPELAPSSTKIVTITAAVTLSKEPKVEDLGNPDSWLKAERYIETTDLSILKLADQLKNPETHETALAIYEWASQNIAYLGYTADDRRAAYALKRLQGDCTENAYLVVALARANGIPSRMVGGYNVDNNAILKATDYHNWAELYFDGAWHLLDAQKQRWAAPTEDYVAFHYYKDQAINPIGLAHRYSQRGEFKVSF